MRDRVGRIQEALGEIDADWAILTCLDSVCYATGHAVPIETGPSPFSGGPTTALVSRDGVVGLVGPNHELGAYPPVDFVETYSGFTWDRPADQVDNYRLAIEAVSKKLGVKGTLGIERASFPRILAEVWSLPIVSIDAALARTRAIKTESELVLLGRAAEIAAIGQRAARDICVAGMSELEVFAGIRQAMERAAGVRVPLAGDFLTGSARTAGTAGWPIERILDDRDPVICDLAPRIAGYWADGCGSFQLGEPTDAYLAMFSAAEQALQAAEAELLPGLRFCDFDGILRDLVCSKGFAYPHHSGHSIGAAVHEYPRIVPYETAPVRENMVLMVEPGAYRQGVGGVRLEFMFRVTATGARAMSKFQVAPALGGLHQAG